MKILFTVHVSDSVFSFMCTTSHILMCVRDSFRVGRKCMKCDEPAVAVARTKDPFCKYVKARVYLGEYAMIYSSMAHMF